MIPSWFQLWPVLVGLGSALTVLVTALVWLYPRIRAVDRAIEVTVELKHGLEALNAKLEADRRELEGKIEAKASSDAMREFGSQLARYYEGHVTLTNQVAAAWARIEALQDGIARLTHAVERNTDTVMKHMLAHGGRDHDAEI
jgi:hypothetical protein